MVNIYSLNDPKQTIICVTKGAYKQVYKSLGYVEVQSMQEEEPEEGKELETIIEDEKPLSEMTIPELYEYAQTKGLEIPKGLSKSEVKNLIRKGVN